MTLSNLMTIGASQRTAVVHVTPALAQEILDCANQRNRRLVPASVEYLAAEMRSGRWRLTHQGIAFGADGVLLDGQSRLAAVVASGETVPMLVHFGLDPETMYAIDTGRRRDNADIIAISTGQTIGTLHMATLRAMYLCRGRARVSPAIEAERWARHADAVRFATSAASGAGLPRLRTAVTCGVVARATYTVPRRVLRDFVGTLYSGIVRSDRDQPVILLMRYLLRSAPQCGPLRVDAYRRTERALRAYVDGESLQSLRPATTELFPLPEERDDAVQEPPAAAAVH